jgi:hypothetical protein
MQNPDLMRIDLESQSAKIAYAALWPCEKPNQVDLLRKRVGCRVNRVGCQPELFIRYQPFRLLGSNLYRKFFVKSPQFYATHSARNTQMRHKFKPVRARIASRVSILSPQIIRLIKRRPNLHCRKFDLDLHRKRLMENCARKNFFNGDFLCRNVRLPAVVS